MPSTKGIQTNSIDYKHTVEFSNIIHTSRLSLDVATMAFRTLVGRFPAKQIAVDSDPTPAQHDPARPTSPALRRALSNPERCELEVVTPGPAARTSRFLLPAAPWRLGEH